jgi:hypothetical protein
MTAESALKVVCETDETNGGYQREPDGKFAPGNKGGPGGSRPGAGRKPQPADESLLSRLYALLDGNAHRALEVLIHQLEHEDPKIAQKAAAIVLSKTLPESRFLQVMKEFLVWKMEKDIAEAEEKEKDHPPDEIGPQGEEIVDSRASQAF